MTSDNQQLSYPPEHPEDLLGAYALGALEAAERDNLEAHLDSCADCTVVLAELAGTTELLAQSVPQVAAPAYLQSQVMAAVDELPPVFALRREEREAVAPEPAPADSSARFTFSSFAMPLAATLVIGLLSASLIMNVITTDRLNSLEQERQETNARLIELERGHAAASAGLSQLAADGQHTNSALRQVMETSYLMARPFTQPLMLLPTDGRSDSEGILLVTGDGRKAILMLANMDQTQPSQGYQVWLSRNGQQWPVGQISVDSSGWGTVALNPPESLYGYDWMNLTRDESASGAGGGGEMVLQTRILSPGAR